MMFNDLFHGLKKMLQRNRPVSRCVQSVWYSRAPACKGHLQLTEELRKWPKKLQTKGFMSNLVSFDSIIAEVLVLKRTDNVNLTFINTDQEYIFLRNY